MSVFRELKRMTRPPAPTAVCAHLSAPPPGAGQETLDEAVSSALLNTLLAARRGHPGAEGELLDLMDRTDGTSEHASKVWGRLGAGALRGETARTGRVDWWQRW